jgi:hypothetical protein
MESGVGARRVVQVALDVCGAGRNGKLDWAIGRLLSVQKLLDSKAWRTFSVARRREVCLRVEIQG